MSDTFGRIMEHQNRGYKKLDTNFTVNDLVKFVFISEVRQRPSCAKFDALKNTIYNNLFLTDENRNYILDIFMDAQKAYHALSRFAQAIVYKRSRKFDNSTDLTMNPLDDYADHLKITLLENENRTLYTFKLGDLTTLITKRLGNSSNFFADPLDIVNPYTNISLSDRNLHLIYMKCKSSNFTIPTLFHRFFISGFDLDRFLDDNECLLRSHAIDDFVRTATERQKYKKIRSMLYFYRQYTDYLVDYTCQRTVMKTFAFLLRPYLNMKFSLNPTTRFKAERLIEKELRKWVAHRRSPFHKYMARNVYRNLAADFDLVDTPPRGPRQNMFLFGQHNQIHDEDDAEDTYEADDPMDDVISDNDVDDRYAIIAHNDNPSSTAGALAVNALIASAAEIAAAQEALGAGASWTEAMSGFASDAD